MRHSTSINSYHPSSRNTVIGSTPAALRAERVVGEDNSIADRAKVLKKELSRKARGAVQQLVVEQVPTERSCEPLGVIRDHREA